MKTIKQVADMLGVSRQAIYRRLSDLPSAMLSIDNKGVQRISEDGTELLRTKLSDEQSADCPNSPLNSPDSPPDSIADTLISMLKDELNFKNEQLTAKDKQIEEKDKQIIELISSNKILSESINAAHHNELAETVIDGQKFLSNTANTANPAPEKVSLWNKIFRRRDRRDK